MQNEYNLMTNVQCALQNDMGKAHSVFNHKDIELPIPTFSKTCGPDNSRNIDHEHIRLAQIRPIELAECLFIR